MLFIVVHCYVLHNYDKACCFCIVLCNHIKFMKYALQIKHVYYVYLIMQINAYLASLSWGKGVSIHMHIAFIIYACINYYVTLHIRDLSQI